MTVADPGRVLRLALLGWGLGHIALGRPMLGTALLTAELAALGTLVLLTLSLADTTYQLVPFLAGVAFIVAWAWQAVAAYRSAATASGAHSIPDRSPAASIAWLSLPLLVWGSGFWLLPADGASPAAALDRFVSESDAILPGLSVPFDDVRYRITERTETSATALAEAVRYERRDGTMLWVFPGSEIVPVTVGTLFEVDLEAVPEALGARRWRVVGTDAG